MNIWRTSMANGKCPLGRQIKQDLGGFKDRIISVFLRVHTTFSLIKIKG